MKTHPLALCAAAALGAGAGVRAEEPDEPADEPAKGQAKVQLAILLDTSGSMSGLIEQTKTQLWKIVNTFMGAKQNGQVPFVEVALYEYGNDGLDAETLWIRQIQPLTRDLDQISSDLFSLTTNGGSEYCGAVIRQAATDLSWDVSADVYKAIFIAGNEEFTQGPIEPAASCRQAIAKGVIVNTIHCGDETAGINGGWKSGAVLADGRYLVIDHNQAVVHVEAPQDPEIVKLNEELNKTYIPYGKEGAVRARSQVAQDTNAAANASAGALVQRVATKASINYCNTHWDLVDACQAKDFDWSKIAEEDLPAELRKMSPKERTAYVAEKHRERAEVQAKIQELTNARDEYVAEARRAAAEEGGNQTLEKAVTEAVVEQAAAIGYEFGE